MRTPSELAEEVRYLPQSNTGMPGPFRFDVTPYMREPLDCLAVDSPISEIAMMKGVQMGVTTAFIENGVLYVIVQVKTSPVLFATATLQLAKERLEGFILPMLQQSKLSHLIQTADEESSQKKGKTKDRIEWVGGGRMNLIGANSTSGMRSLPIRFLFRDEIDDPDWQSTKDGDSLALTEARTKTFEGSRKIVDVSTPALKGNSKIEARFRRGDQRHYFVRCLGCGEAQTLSSQRRDIEHKLYGWRRTDPETGVVSGFVWDTDPTTRKLIPGSVRWLCHECGHAHTNDDKTRLLSPDHGAEWRPTAEPEAPYIRSYHISALYSPVGMQTWEACVRDWLEAWDEERGEVKDPAKLQVFYNNILGETYEVTGDRLTVKHVSPHRRGIYRYGEVPNRWLQEHTAGPMMFAVCTVDVHKDNLAVAVWGFCRGTRVLLIKYDRFVGNCEDPEDPATWGRLQDLIEGAEYKADDGKHYRIELALVDSGYIPDTVHQFCSRMGTGVFPVVGRGQEQGGGKKHWTLSQNKMGADLYLIGVDLYKDRLGAVLKRRWDGSGLQPAPYFNAPSDASDEQLKELTVEQRVAVTNSRTGDIVCWTWRRPSGSRNELWDLLVYAYAAHDILAHGVCTNFFELEEIDDVAIERFHDACIEQGEYFYE